MQDDTRVLSVFMTTVGKWQESVEDYLLLKEKSKDNLGSEISFSNKKCQMYGRKKDNNKCCLFYMNVICALNISQKINKKKRRNVFEFKCITTMKKDGNGNVFSFNSHIQVSADIYKFK